MLLNNNYDGKRLYVVCSAYSLDELTTTKKQKIAVLIMQSDYRFLSTLYGKYGNYDYDDQFLIFLTVIRETGRNKKTTLPLCSEDEDRLLVDLFKGYNNLIQPVHGANQTMTVTFGLQLVLLINVDEKNQIVHTNVWITLYKFSIY
uniref:Neurotransmitter-gated ion-channel ligand-binding domain-containing protein n=1 Tax=Romanomermis culicivorax TaxID=13658 RepID=A0A915IX10_ROMCU